MKFVVAVSTLIIGTVANASITKGSQRLLCPSGWTPGNGYSVLCTGHESDGTKAAIVVDEDGTIHKIYDDGGRTASIVGKTVWR